MTLLTTYSSFILPFVLAFIAGVLLNLVFSYKKRFKELKERTDNTIAYQERELERAGIELAETCKKLRKAESDLTFLKQQSNMRSGLYGDHSSVKRHTPIERHEAKAAPTRQEEVQRNYESTYTSSNDTATYMLFANQNIATTNVSKQDDTNTTIDKPTYQPYVNSGCGNSSSSDYSSSDSGSSSSDSCSSSSND